MCVALGSMLSTEYEEEENTTGKLGVVGVYVNAFVLPTGDYLPGEERLC